MHTLTVDNVSFRYDRNVPILRDVSFSVRAGEFLSLVGPLRLAKPGDRFDVQVSPEGKFILTKLEGVRGPPPAKVRIQKRGRYHVRFLDNPIS